MYRMWRRPEQRRFLLHPVVKRRTMTKHNRENCDFIVFLKSLGDIAIADRLSVGDQHDLRER